jgi:hypothetical protein
VLLPSADPSKSVPALSTANIEALAKQILVECLPAKFEENKDWGKQVERPDLKFHGRGLNIRVEARKKSVNHGLWKAYKVFLVNPKEQLTFRIVDLKVQPDHRMTFTLQASVPVTAEGTVQEWSYGFKLFGVTAEAEAIAVAALECEIRARFSEKSFFPELIIQPKVNAAKLSVRDFRVKRIGEIGGTLTKELTSEVRRIVERAIHKEEHKLPEKANAAVRKKHPEGKITVSPLQLLE